MNSKFVGWVEARNPAFNVSKLGLHHSLRAEFIYARVIPAKAGIHSWEDTCSGLKRASALQKWIPAFAGMTDLWESALG